MFKGMRSRIYWSLAFMPWYLPLMLVLTGGYLLLEGPFAPTIGAVIGGAATLDEVHQMERFGRMLSGAAMAIAVLGVWHFPRMERIYAKKAAAIALAVPLAFVVGLATYMAIDGYATWRAWDADGAERKDALIAMLAKRSLSDKGMNGALDVPAEQWAGMVATMPVIMKMKDMLSLNGENIATLVDGETTRAIGTPDKLRRDFFEKNFGAAHAAFTDYQDATDKIRSASRDVDNRAQDAWYEYKSEMDRRFSNGWPPEGSTRAALVWRKVHMDKAIPVPEGWRIRDKATFLAAVKTKVRQEIVEEYTRQIELHLGKGAQLMPDLPFEAFVKNPAVQKKIRDEMWQLDLPKGVVISPDMPQATFVKAIYAPQHDKATDELMKAVSAPPADFERGSLAAKGMDAVKSVQLPALAILLSLTGAIVHIFKFTSYAVTFLGYLFDVERLKSGIARHVVAFAVVAVAGWSMLGLTPSSFKSESIDRIATGGGIYASLVKGAVVLQPQLATIGDTLAQAGPWKLVAAELPQPRPFALAAVASTTSEQADPVEVASVDVSPEVSSELARIPLPIARPTN
jgi:hypothetical protein